MTISQFRILSSRRNRNLRYNKRLSGQLSRHRARIYEMEAQRVGERVQEVNKFRYIFAIIVSLAASVTSGAIFLFSLIHQLALVEIAASLVTAAQVFFFSSAIADLLEKAQRPSRRRLSLVVLFTVFLVAFYSFTRYYR